MTTPPTTPAPTPETDKKAIAAWKYSHDSSYTPVVPADFARRLERERDELMALACEFHDTVIGHGTAGAYDPRRMERAIVAFDLICARRGIGSTEDIKDTLMEAENIVKLRDVERERDEAREQLAKAEQRRADELNCQQATHNMDLLALQRERYEARAEIQRLIEALKKAQKASDEITNLIKCMKRAEG